MQVATLTAAGCGVVRQEKAGGTTTKGRPELATVLAFLQKGDTLVVTRIDRLARSLGDLQEIIKTIKEKGANLECTEQPVNTGTAAGKAFLDMLGVFAEFETNLRKERQLEGIAAAKTKGVYKGRNHAGPSAKDTALTVPAATYAHTSQLEDRNVAKHNCNLYIHRGYNGLGTLPKVLATAGNTHLWPEACTYSQTYAQGYPPKLWVTEMLFW